MFAIKSTMELETRDENVAKSELPTNLSKKTYVFPVFFVFTSSSNNLFF